MAVFDNHAFTYLVVGKITTDIVFYKQKESFQLPC
ncbi:hypothetical protein SAMN06265367_101379 [Algoriphagus winogradskyi]|uniref:Uncharacterized protein n=1 Tax=Algoriphagus winogradskyi TaxID=237017 RepID=A0ABY1NC12_9BACT|nr:hypothetical protein SAMN06265367_101379 [Algoriphagus winogradskyi]